MPPVVVMRFGVVARLIGVGNGTSFIVSLRGDISGEVEEVVAREGEEGGGITGREGVMGDRAGRSEEGDEDGTGGARSGEVTTARRKGASERMSRPRGDCGESAESADADCAGVDVVSFRDGSELRFKSLVGNTALGFEDGDALSEPGASGEDELCGNWRFPPRSRFGT